MQEQTAGFLVLFSLELKHANTHRKHPPRRNSYRLIPLASVARAFAESWPFYPDVWCCWRAVAAGAVAAGAVAAGAGGAAAAADGGEAAADDGATAACRAAGAAAAAAAGHAPESASCE